MYALIDDNYTILFCILIVSIASIIGRIIYIVYEYKLKQKEKLNNPERFCFKIIEESDHVVSTSFLIPKTFSGADIGIALRSGLAGLKRQDPILVRLLLLQTLEILCDESDIQEALASFKRKVS